MKAAVACSGSSASDSLLTISPLIICFKTNAVWPLLVFLWKNSYQYLCITALMCTVCHLAVLFHTNDDDSMGVWWDVMWNWRDAKHFHMTKCCATFSEASVAIIPVSKNTFYDTDHCIHQMTSHLLSRSVIITNKKEILTGTMTHSGKLPSALLAICTRNAWTFHFL